MPDKKNIEVNEIKFKKAQIQTQSFCNASCIMCPYGSTSQTLPQGKMKWELFQKVIDDLLSYPSLKHISLMLQNEPLLNKNIIDEIRYVRNKKSEINISINTNGLNLTKEFATQLTEAGLNTLIFSINGLTKETFEHIEKGLDYEIIMANLMNLIKYKPPKLNVAVKCMVIKNNAIEFSLPDKFSNLAELLQKHQISLDISPISNRAGSLEQYDDLLIFEHLQSSRNKLLCEDLFETINILYNGDVISCCADWNRESVLGNLKKQSIEEVFIGKEMIRRRKIILDGKYDQLKPCADCSQAKNIMNNLQQITRRS